MYQRFFGLKELPFKLTPDTQFFCGLPTHVEALNTLLIALESGEGFIKITGNVGTGKTMLCRKLLNELGSPFITAYIPNPRLSPTGLHLAIANEIGIYNARKIHPSRLLPVINDCLIFAAQSQNRPVLIIDEAQAMPIETLEALRLLTNLETEKQKLLQIVLFGQPELDTLLSLKKIRQLKQRITFSYQLKELTPKQISTYLQHRLKIAGADQNLQFSWLGCLAMAYYSQGIPRLINILAHKALLVAFGRGKHRVSLPYIHAAAQDTEATNQCFMLLRCHKVYYLGLIIVLLMSIWTNFWPKV